MSDLLLQNASSGSPSTIYFCKVTRFYASSNTVDVVSIDDNISLMGCMILCSMPSGFSFGEKYIPSLDDSDPETSYIMSPADVYCLATFIEDYQQPVVLGFLFPKETTLSIPDYGLYIFRHESDVMWMIRGDGTLQMYHPSGSMIKIGSDSIDEMSNSLMIPATASDFNVRDVADYNANKESNLFIKWYMGQEIILDKDGKITAKVKDGDTEKAIMTLDPAGTITFSLPSNGTYEISCPGGTVNITANQINMIKG